MKAKRKRQAFGQQVIANLMDVLERIRRGDAITVRTYRWRRGKIIETRERSHVFGRKRKATKGAST